MESHSNVQSKYLGPACQSNICPFEYNDNYLAGFKECYGKGYRLFNPCESEKPKYKFKIVNQIVENFNQLLSLECSWFWLLVDKRSIFSFVLFSLTRTFSLFCEGFEEDLSCLEPGPFFCAFSIYITVQRGQQWKIHLFFVWILK